MSYGRRRALSDIRRLRALRGCTNRTIRVEAQLDHREPQYDDRLEAIPITV